jgi:ArsR family transcriptional regulator
MGTFATIRTPCCTPDSPPLPRQAREHLAEAFKALSDPTRVGILNCLARSGEVCVCVLTDEFDVSQPTISHHLRVLREAGLIEATKRGKWAYYRVRSEAVATLAAALGGH